MLKIFLLGTFQLEFDGTPVPENAWHTKQARQLLKILLTYRGRIVPRDILIEALWPNAEPHKAATTLRTAVNALRKTLEPNRPPYTESSFIVAHAPGYKFQLSEKVWVDAIAFDALLDEAEQTSNPTEKEAQLEAALALYSDDYLCNDIYEDWTAEERDRLQERYLTALAELAEYHAAQGQFDRAIAGLRRVLTRDPGREPVYRMLMRYHMRVGDMVAALKSFEQLRQYLADELGADPSPQTLALHQAVLNGQLDSPVSPAFPGIKADSPLETVFVGRQKELKRLTDALMTLSPHHGQIVCISGESGVGKTRLANAMLHQAAGADITVLAGRCQLAEQSLPFAPIVEAIEPFIHQNPTILTQFSVAERAQLAQLFPSLVWQMDVDASAPLLTEMNRRVVVTTLVKLMLTLASNPLTLFIDDVQWADEATLTLLANLSRYVPQTAILLAIAYRPEEVTRNAPVNAFLQDLSHRGTLISVLLTRLTEAETHTLLRAIAPNSGDLSREVKRIHKLTGGNPLFISESIRAVLDAHPDAFQTGLADTLLADTAALTEPSSHIADVIVSRLAHLPSTARAVLDIGAVIGRDFSVDLLETIAATDPLAALSELMKRQFLVEISAGRLDFSHQLVRDVIYQQLSPLARRRLHQRIADALILLFGRQPGPHAAEIAEHSLHAGAATREQAMIFSVLAGEFSLNAFGFEQAVHHFRQAIDLANNFPEIDVAERWIQQAHEKLGKAYEGLMAWDSAREVYHQCQIWAEQRGNRTMALMAQYRLATMLGLIGHLEESAALTARITKELPPQTPDIIIRAQNRLQLLSSTRDTPPTWTESGFPVFQQQPVHVERPWEVLAEFLGDEQAAQTLNLYGWALTLQGESESAAEALAHAARLAEIYQQPGLSATSYHLQAQLWDLRGDYGVMTQSLNRALAMVENNPHLRWIVIWGRIHRAYVDVRWNQLDRAAERFQRLDTELTEHTALRSHRLSVKVGLGLLAMFRNRPAEAEHNFNFALENVEDLYASNYVVLHVSRARLFRHQHQFEDAERAIVQAMAFAAERGMLADYISALAEASRFSLAVGQPADVLHLLQRAETMATRADLLPARLSVRLALYRTFSQLEMPDDAAWFRRLARTDRDTIAATIPDADDRAAYLSRRDLQNL